jgi:alcohol dehydrogenase (NADP+)
MPWVGCGCANTSERDGERMFTAQDVAGSIKTALELGFTHIDCAPLYGNQHEIGETAFASLSSEHRGEIWITSKLWLTNFEAQHVRPALIETLQSLRLSYLDLYLMHAPVGLQYVGIPFAKGDSTPRDAVGNALLSGVPHSETWRALEACVEERLCGHIGVSNFTLQELDSLISLGGIVPYANQIELHPYCQRQQLVDGCIARGVRPVAFSPLGSGPNAVLRAYMYALRPCGTCDMRLTACCSTTSC